jgi:hypothetical protein
MIQFFRGIYCLHLRDVCSTLQMEVACSPKSFITSYMVIDGINHRREQLQQDLILGEANSFQSVHSSTKWLIAFNVHSLQL